jgi:hypothetical protein
MPKKCPEGVICFENFTLVMFLFIALVLIYFLFFVVSPSYTNNNNIVVKKEPSSNTILSNLGLARFWNIPSYPYTNNDVLINPYVPPLKDDRYIMRDTIPLTIPSSAVPINVPTQGVDSSYRQVGILTRTNTNEPLIMPLMGRPTITNRDKWQYYCMNNSVKLPMSHNGKSCTAEYGCDGLYNGDTVYVEGYDDTFKITMYDNNTIRYIPYI